MKKITYLSFFCLVFTLFINSSASAKLNQERTSELVSVSELKPPPYISEADRKNFSLWKDVYQEKKNQRELYEKKGEFLNELVLSDSPYLKQHAKNPINWKSWSQSVLDKAKSENRLILLSIGYSTCHWCHVMAKESFSELEVGKAINKDFIAIKVDRELHPQIDDYYARALEATKGSAGWPITAIIDGDGLPLFIDSYLSKSRLLKLLPKIKSIWKSQPEFLLETAKNINKTVQANRALDHQHYAAIDFEEFFNDLNMQLVKQLDPKFGGFKGQVKFPSEPMMLYALDQVRRGKSTALRDLVKTQLDTMLNSGIYDHISGGFHRYATDSEWNIPHFEKMLYNQAQMVIVLTEAFQLYHDQRYLAVAKETVDFVMAEMYLTNKGFFAAVDADFNGKEGAYYTWTTSEIRLVDKEQYFKTIEIAKNEYIITRDSKRVKLAQRNELRKRFDLKRKKRGAVFTDKKILTGWNGLMLKALVDVGLVLDEQKYINTAIKVASHLWQERYNIEGNELNRISQSVGTASLLEDSSYFGQALIALHDATLDKAWLTKAELLAKASVRVIGLDVKTRASHEVVREASSNLEKFILYRSRDSETIADLAAALALMQSVKSRAEKDSFVEERKALLKLAEFMIVKTPLDHLSLAKGVMVDAHSDSSYLRALPQGKGVVEVECIKASKGSCEQLKFNFTLDEGWHLNSNNPLQDHLQATKFQSRSEFKVIYPEARIVKLGFQKEPLSLFEGQFSIVVELEKSGEVRELIVPIQVCSDSICLLPIEYLFRT